MTYTQSLNEFLSSWWMQHWTKTYGENKPCWTGGPSIEELRSCDERKEQSEYLRVINHCLSQINHFFDRGQHQVPPGLFESVG